MSDLVIPSGREVSTLAPVPDRGIVAAIKRILPQVEVRWNPVRERWQFYDTWAEKEGLDGLIFTAQGPAGEFVQLGHYHVKILEHAMFLARKYRDAAQYDRELEEAAKVAQAKAKAADSEARIKETVSVWSRIKSKRERWKERKKAAPIYSIPKEVRPS